MIVCSCNVLSDQDVKACLSPGPGCPRTPAQVYRCLGCSPSCGRCAATIRSIMDEALAAGAMVRTTACDRGYCSMALAEVAAEPTREQFQVKWIRFTVENAAQETES